MVVRKVSFVGLLIFSAGLLGACQSGAPPIPDTPTPNATLTAIFAENDLALEDSFSTAAAETATAQAKPNGALLSTPTLPPISTSTQKPTPSGNERRTLTPTNEPGGATSLPGAQPTIVSSDNGQPIVLSFDDVLEATEDGDTDGVEVDSSKRAGPGVQAFYLASAPVIDGDLSDFDAPSYALNSVVYGKGYHSGEKDLSGVFQIGWDESNLYISVIVFDSKFKQESEGPQLYRGDSLEILLDTGIVGDYSDPLISDDDFQIGISPGNLLEDGEPEAYIWAPRILEGAVGSAEVAARLTADGYVLEAAIPWVSLGTAPFEGQHMGFLFSISDNDDPRENTQQSVVSFAPSRIIHDPTTWFDLWLIKP